MRQRLTSSLARATPLLFVVSAAHSSPLPPNALRGVANSTAHVLDPFSYSAVYTVRSSDPCFASAALYQNPSFDGRQTCSGQGGLVADGLEHCWDAQESRFSIVTDAALLRRPPSYDVYLMNMCDAKEGGAAPSFTVDRFGWSLQLFQDLTTFAVERRIYSGAGGAPPKGENGQCVLNLCHSVLGEPGECSATCGSTTVTLSWVVRWGGTPGAAAEHDGAAAFGGSPCERARILLGSNASSSPE